MTSDGKTRRDFIFIATGAVAAGGMATASWPMIAHLGPAADIKGRGFDVDLSDLEAGQQLKVLWKGKPVFIRHRTPAEIEAAKNVDIEELIHFETDGDRLRNLPNGSPSEAGDFDGWYCPCHGAHFDTSGRVRKGPAPKNMEIPPYQWLSETKLTIYYDE